MSIETTRDVITAYLHALAERGAFAHYFADDVTLTIMGCDYSAQGRESVEQSTRGFYEHAFDSHLEVKALYPGDTHATIEAEFVGQHSGEFLGIPASHQQVRVPYVVVYDLRDDKITALRLYMPMNALLEQITTTANPAITAA